MPAWFKNSTAQVTSRLTAVRGSSHWQQPHNRLIGAVLLIAIAGGLWSAGKALTHQSLSHIYLGSVAVRADEPKDEVLSALHQAVAGYQLRLEPPNGDNRDYSLSEIGLGVDAEASYQALQQSLDSSWPGRLLWWRDLNVPLAVKTHNRQFEDFLNHQAIKATVAVRNAKLVIDNGELKVESERVGRGVTLPDAQKVILNDVQHLAGAPLKQIRGPIEPQIVASDLDNSRQQAEKILSRHLSLDIGGHQISPSRADIGHWIDLNAVPKEKTIDVTVNSGKVLEYINNIARPYVQPPRDRLVIQLHGQHSVIDKGADGLDVLNKNAVAADIAKRLPGENNIDIKLSVSYAKARTVLVQTYPKWIIADTTTHRMYAYEKTKLIRTFLVTAGAPLTPTVTGQYKIYAKYASQDMRGANVDGSRYFQPDVPYVNYFYGGYAIHGNYWRPVSYFGSVNSSHGCIGILPADAKWIYDWASIGTPVIIHT